MARRTRTWFRSETFIFWGATLAICAVVAAVGYHVGRNFVGKYLAGETEQTRTINQPLAPEPVSPEEVRKRLAPEVVVIDREPTEAERLALGVDESEQPEEQAGEDTEDQEQAAEESEPASEQAEAGQPAEQPEAAEGQDEQAAAEGPVPVGGGPVQPSSGAKWIATAGSYKERSNAEQVVAALAAKGIQAHVVEVTVHGEKYHRVVVGPFDGVTEANAVASVIKSAGYPSQVMQQR